jgi:hypothetical protein
MGAALRRKTAKKHVQDHTAMGWERELAFAQGFIMSLISSSIAIRRIAF